MLRSEIIVWRAESMTQLEKEHPDWGLKKRNSYLDKIQKRLFGKESLVLLKGQRGGAE